MSEKIRPSEDARASDPLVQKMDKDFFQNKSLREATKNMTTDSIVELRELFLDLAKEDRENLSAEIEDELNRLLEEGTPEDIDNFARGLLRRYIEKAKKSEGTVGGKDANGDKAIEGALNRNISQNIHLDRVLNPNQDSLEQKLEEGKWHIDTFFSKFPGGRENFEKINPEFKDWIEAAKKRIQEDEKWRLKTSEFEKPEKSEELRIRAELLVLQEKRVEIATNAKRWLSAEDYRLFIKGSQESYRGIRASLEDLQVAYRPSRLPPLASWDEELVKIRFSPEEQQNILRQWSELRSARGQGIDKVFDLKSGLSYLERDGLKIQMPETQTQSHLHELAIQKRTLEREISNIEQSLDGTSEYMKRTVGNLGLASFDHLDISVFDRVLGKLESDFNSSEISEEEKVSIKKIWQSIFELRSEYVKKQELLAQKRSELQKIQNEQDQIRNEERKNVEASDKEGSENLSYLSSLWLDILGQEGLDFFIDLINRERNNQKNTLISLRSGFSLEMKFDLANTLERLVGKHPPILMRDEIPPMIRPDVNIGERLRSAWVLDGANVFNPVKMEEIFKKKGE